MGWEIGYDSSWDRDIGYGVVAYCDQPGCRKVIDRGLSYVCSGKPYGGDDGCGLYFCHKHHSHYRNPDDDNDEAHSLCVRCARGSKPFKPKSEHPRWLRWKLSDSSWAEWREENPNTVRRYREQIKRQTTGSAAGTKAAKKGNAKKR